VRITGDPDRVPRALKLSAPANVTFTGFLPLREFLGEMLAADAVAVFSTDPHIMNRAAFEAVGLGRPLVLSDLTGLRERFGPARLSRPLRRRGVVRPQPATRNGRCPAPGHCRAAGAGAPQRTAGRTTAPAARPGGGQPPRPPGRAPAARTPPAGAQDHPAPVS